MEEGKEEDKGRGGQKGGGGDGGKKAWEKERDWME